MSLRDNSGLRRPSVCLFQGIPLAARGRQVCGYAVSGSKHRTLSGVDAAMVSDWKLFTAGGLALLLSVIALLILWSL